MARHRLKVDLAYPVNADVDAALRTAADLVAEAEARRNAVVSAAVENGLMREARAGEVVDDLPARSLPWLLKQGLIEVIEADVDEESC